MHHITLMQRKKEAVVKVTDLLSHNATLIIFLFNLDGVEGICSSFCKKKTNIFSSADKRPTKSWLTLDTLEKRDDKWEKLDRTGGASKRGQCLSSSRSH